MSLNFTIRRILVAGVAGCTLLVTACGDTGTETSPDPQSSVSETSSLEEDPTTGESPTAEESPSAEDAPPITPAADLSGITVTGDEVPEIEFETPWAIAETQSRVLVESDNPQMVADDSIVTVRYKGVNGRTGEVFDDAPYQTGQPIAFSLQQVVPGFQKGLSGQRVGSTVLIGMPPEDGYPQGRPPHIEPGDSLVFVVEIVSANFEEATGEAVTPAEGLPSVTMGDAGAELAAPQVEPPSELVIQPLIQGTGPVVGQNAVISVKFRSWNWATGEMLEDAWHPQQGPLPQLIEGWKQGLVNQPTGSRVMLVVPPDLAYPDGNAAHPEVEPGQTLVYVIDILHAADQG